MNINELKETGKTTWKKHKVAIVLGAIVLGSYGLGHKRGEIIGKNKEQGWLIDLVHVNPSILDEISKAGVSLLEKSK